jgi:predicted Fe-S protein YdhL (DUF1289 family)
MIKSPCVNVCKIDYESGYCIGCNRTTEEITNWSSFNDSQKKNSTNAKSKNTSKQKKFYLIKMTKHKLA